MNIKTLGAVAVVTAALTVPAVARYHHVQHGPSYHGPAYGYGWPAYGARTFRSAYARLPVGEPFYGDSFSRYDDGFSRVGGTDPDMHPSGN